MAHLIESDHLKAIYSNLLQDNATFKVFICQSNLQPKAQYTTKSTSLPN